jgi:hypothetical protein
MRQRMVKVAGQTQVGLAKLTPAVPLILGGAPRGRIADTPAEFSGYIRKEVDKWRKVIVDAKIPQIP